MAKLSGIPLSFSRKWHWDFGVQAYAVQDHVLGRDPHLLKTSRVGFRDVTPLAAMRPTLQVGVVLSFDAELEVRIGDWPSTPATGSAASNCISLATSRQFSLTGRYIESSTSDPPTPEIRNAGTGPMALNGRGGNQCSGAPEK